MVKKADTTIGRKLWREVDKAARGCPEWIRPQVERAAEASARRLAGRKAAVANHRMDRARRQTMKLKIAQALVKFQGELTRSVMASGDLGLVAAFGELLQSIIQAINMKQDEASG